MSMVSVWNLYDSIQCELLKRWTFIICLNIGDCLFFDFCFFHQYFLAMALRLHRPMLDADVEYTFLFRDCYFCMLLPLGRCFLFLWIFTDTTIPERKRHENAWFDFKWKRYSSRFEIELFCTYILLWCIFCSKLYCSFYLLYFFSSVFTPQQQQKFPNNLLVAQKYTTFSAC